MDDNYLETQGDAEKLRLAVEFLQSMRKEMEGDLVLRSLQIGRYIVETFFDGDIREVVSHNPAKNQSFMRLCQLADLPFPPTALRRFVYMYINSKQLPECLCLKLLPTHHQALYRVVDANVKCEIARRAVEENLSVCELRSLVKHHSRRAPGGGRKLQPAIYKDARDLVTLVRQMAGHRSTSGVSPKQRDEILRLAREARALLTDLVDSIAEGDKKPK